jgi:hypothetical protein
MFDALKLCQDIIRKFGRTEYEKGQGENSLLRFVISMIVVRSLSNRDKDYGRLLIELVRDESYNYEVKKQIAFECKRSIV